MNSSPATSSTGHRGFLRSLRGTYKTGLISNAWSDLREYLVREKIIDAFDQIIISAEVGVAKPEAKIFHIALEQAGVSPKKQSSWMTSMSTSKAVKRLA